MEDYKTYKILYTVYFGTKPEQIAFEVLCTNIEAMHLNELLNRKIEKLVQTNAPISISLQYRSTNNEIVFHGWTNVVAIEHNIPEFQIVEDGD